MDATVDMVDCQNLTPGSRVDVETKTRHYRIEWLGGNRIRIFGHPQICPEPVPAWLEGSIARDGSIESGLIECGMPMAFLVGNAQPVRTSRVIGMHVHSVPEDESQPAPAGF
jgi:hypothetical protein